MQKIDIFVKTRSKLNIGVYTVVILYVLIVKINHGLMKIKIQLNLKF